MHDAPAVLCRRACHAGRSTRVGRDSGRARRTHTRGLVLDLGRLTPDVCEARRRRLLATSSRNDDPDGLAFLIALCWLWHGGPSLRMDKSPRHGRGPPRGKALSMPSGRADAPAVEGTAA